MGALDAVVPGLGLATSVVGNVVGGIQQAKIAEQQQQNLNQEKNYSEGLFNREYYQDAIKRSENQSFLRELNNNQKENKVRAKRTAAITGATDESTATQSKTDGNVYASAVNRMAALASQRKDMALASYNANRRALYGQQNQVLDAKKAAIGTFMGNASNLGTGALSAMTETPKVDGLGAVNKGIIIPDEPLLA